MSFSCFLGKWFCPGMYRDRGVCPGTGRGTRKLFCPGTKGQRDKEKFFVPGQRDSVTRKHFCPGTKGQRDVPRDVSSLGNPSSNFWHRGVTIFAREWVKKSQKVSLHIIRFCYLVLAVHHGALRCIKVYLRHSRCLGTFSLFEWHNFDKDSYFEWNQKQGLHSNPTCSNHTELKYLEIWLIIECTYQKLFLGNRRGAQNFFLLFFP